MIAYSLDGNAGGRFGIVGNTIFVADGTLLDFETATSHTVTVRATDGGGKFVLETLKINVVDAPEAHDFGDLPDSFGTTLASNGHDMNSSIHCDSALRSPPKSMANRVPMLIQTRVTME